MATLRSIARHRVPFQQHSFNRRSFSSTSSPPSSRIRTTCYTAVLAVSAGFFATYYFDARSAIHRYVIMPILRHTCDTETGHRIAVKVLQNGLAPRDLIQDDDILRSEVEYILVRLIMCSLLSGQIFGFEVSNPVGLAAGFDKHGEAIDGAFLYYFLGVHLCTNNA